MRPVPFHVTVRYGYDPNYEGNAQHIHWGWDFPCFTGEPVRAVLDGTVLLAGVEQPRGFFGVTDGAWGTVVSIVHEEDLITDYCHLSELAVFAYQKVKAGDIIGYSGETGLTFGQHLHFQVRKHGLRINPKLYFGQWLAM